MNNFRLAILAAQTANGEYFALQTNLNQAITWLSNTWQLTKPAEANFIFMPLTSTKSLKTLQTLQNSYPIERIIVATSIQIQLPQIKWLLPFSKTQTCPTVLSLVNLLSRIREHFQNQKPGYLDQVFEPMQYLPGIIEQCKQDGTARLCSLDSAVRIILAPKESAYYFAGHLEQLIPLACALNTVIKVESVSEHELADTTGLLNFGSRFNDHAHLDDVKILPGIGVKRSTQGSLSDLLWLSVLIASCGRRLSSYNLNEKIFLLEIPDILLSDYFCVEYNKLSEIFISKPTSVIEASTAAHRSLFDTINFCNACTVLNMTEIGHHP